MRSDALVAGLAITSAVVGGIVGYMLGSGQWTVPPLYGVGRVPTNTPVYGDYSKVKQGTNTPSF